jgi:hypothetical protein
LNCSLKPAFGHHSLLRVCGYMLQRSLKSKPTSHKSKRRCAISCTLLVLLVPLPGYFRLPSLSATKARGTVGHSHTTGRHHCTCYVPSVFQSAQFPRNTLEYHPLLNSPPNHAGESRYLRRAAGQTVPSAHNESQHQHVNDSIRPERVAYSPCALYLSAEHLSIVDVVGLGC